MLSSFFHIRSPAINLYNLSRCCFSVQNLTLEIHLNTIYVCSVLAKLFTTCKLKCWVSSHWQKSYLSPRNFHQKTRKLVMTNTCLFNSRCCAPMLLLFLWLRGIAFYPGICWCAFFFPIGSTPIVSLTQTVHQVQWELSWPQAARVGLWHYLNEEGWIVLVF